VRPSARAISATLCWRSSAGSWAARSNALLAVRFSGIEVMKNAAEIVVYGTAAVIEELKQEE
jgi:hypothetical protein